MWRKLKLLNFFFLCLFFLAACSSKKESNTLKIIATAVPHAEILESIKPALGEKGVNLEIIVVDDYQTPNRALADGEIEANFFQHTPFLEHQVKEFQYPLQVLAAVHLEPMGIYSKKHQNLSHIKNHALIAVPSDPTNLARALLLLEKQGWIKLNSHSPQTSMFNIIDNPHQIRITEIDSPLLVRALEDVDFGVVTTNFALQGGFQPLKDALALEQSDSLFVNVIAIRRDDTNPFFATLKEEINSAKVKKFIEDKYQGAIMPAF